MISRKSCGEIKTYRILSHTIAVYQQDLCFDSTIYFHSYLSLISEIRRIYVGYENRLLCKVDSSSKEKKVKKLFLEKSKITFVNSYIFSHVKHTHLLIKLADYVHSVQDKSPERHSF